MDIQSDLNPSLENKKQFGFKDKLKHIAKVKKSSIINSKQHIGTAKCHVVLKTTLLCQIL